MPKMPRAGEVAACKLNIRLTPAERETFARYAAANGARSTSDFARLLILGEAAEWDEGGRPCGRRQS